VALEEDCEVMVFLKNKFGLPIELCRLLKTVFKIMAIYEKNT
jgi:hypothetical protein